MKLTATLALTSSIARAQDYDLNDLLAGLNMEDLDLGFDLTPDLFSDIGEADAGEAALDSALAASAVEAAEAGVRYFGGSATTATTTTTTATTTSTTNGSGCFKCDQMSMAECAALGQFETCPSGEQSYCFIEIREVNQQVNQLCTGCKNSQACHELKEQNFIGTQYHMHQCRPHYIEQAPGRRSPNGQSTCRQCFKQCENDASTGVTDGMCFFGHDAVFADPTSNLLPSGANDANNNAFSGNRLIQYDQATLKANFVANSAHPLYGYTGGSTIGFGIPTGAQIADTNLGASSIPANGGSTVWNLYFASGADSGNTGKDHPLTSEMTLTSSTAKSQRQMAYWGVLGASRNWWQSDIIAIQNQVLLSTATDKTPLIAV
jgi:hypothetical protein